MNYFVNILDGKLHQGFSAFKDWVLLPEDYQNKIFEDIKAVMVGQKVIIAHHELKPAMLFSDHWSTIGHVKTGTMVNVSEHGCVGFREPWPSPTEQRESFQKNFPHLVKKINFLNTDGVNTSPKHYRQGKIEPWDFIVSQKMGFLEGNIVKYITRYKAKNGLEDLLKAKTYLEKLIKEVSCEKSKD